MTKTQRPIWRSFLVRMWHEDEQTWRSLVENPHTGERFAFTDVEKMLEFLRQEATRPTAEEPPPQ